MSKQELQTEIDYLTKLIESHEASKQLLTYGALSGCNVGAPVATLRHSWAAAGQTKSPNMKYRRRGRNLVYKPSGISNSISVPPRCEQSAPSVSLASRTSEKVVTPSYAVATLACGAANLTPRTHQLVAKKRLSRSSSKKPLKKLKYPSGGQYVWLAKNVAHRYKQSRESLHGKKSDRSQYKWESTDVVMGTGTQQHNPQASSFTQDASNQRGPHLDSGSGSTPINHPRQLLKAIGTSNRLHSLKSSGRFQLKVPFCVVAHSHSCVMSPNDKVKLTTFTTFRKRNRVWLASGGNPTDTQQPAAGSETLSKRGNKVWVSASLPGARRVSSDRVWKRKNKVWVSSLAGSTTPNQKKVTDKQRGLRQQDFVVDKGGKRMRRLSSVPCAPSTPLIKRALASHVLKKSLAHVWHARRQAHLNPASSQQCCTFYNRFGKCTRGDKCPFIHDPERVAVCTKFLRGVCTKTDGTCPFYHKATKEKMPVCSFFLRGVCARDGCPYLHVSVGKNAEVCPDFVKGYCAKGEQCNKKHIIDCPEFSKSGTCPQGKKCPLRHRQRTNRPLSPLEKATISPVKEPYAFRKIRQKLELRQMILAGGKGGAVGGESVLITPKELEFIPLEAPLGKEREQAPDFIAL